MMGRSRTRKRGFALALIGVAAAVAMVPYIIATTSLSNSVVGLAVAPANMRATVSSASFGWFSPLSVDGLRLTTSRGEPLAEVGRFEAEMPWWRLALARPDLGQFQVDRPRVELIVGEDGTNFRSVGEGAPSGEDETTLSVKVRGGSFLVRYSGSDRPVLRLEKLDLDLRIDRADTGRVLTVDPVELLDRQRLTRAMCSDGLRLIAPVLADTADVEGEISLRLDELSIPIDTTEGRHIRGRLRLHGVQAGLKDSWLAGVMQFVGVALNTNVPTMVRIADSADICFHVENDRVHHEGLAFGLPEVSRDLVIRTRGSVGFDESIDLKVDIPGLRRLVARRIGPEFPTTGQLEISVRGTFDQPEIALPAAAGAVAQLLAGLLDDGMKHTNAAAMDPLVDEVTRGVRGLLQSVSEPEYGSDGRRSALPFIPRLGDDRWQSAHGRPRR